ncbi:MAG: SRPBCC family protein [Actinomycetota bacterium]
MSHLRVEVMIEATPEQVWEEVRHIDRHVDWMRDAVEITFLDEQRSGVGTTFDTLTKVGPLSTMDRLEITEWVEHEAMGVKHTGSVTGVGRFTLEPVGEATRFVWEEELEFPWFFGGPIGGRVGAPILGAIWRRNLAALKEIVETGERPEETSLRDRASGLVSSVRERLGR